MVLSCVGVSVAGYGDYGHAHLAVREFAVCVAYFVAHCLPWVLEVVEILGQNPYPAS